MEALLNFITGLGVIAVLFVIYAESGLLIGFLFPGDSSNFYGGFLFSKVLAHLAVSASISLPSYCFSVRCSVSKPATSLAKKSDENYLIDQIVAFSARKIWSVPSSSMKNTALLLLCSPALCRLFVPRANCGRCEQNDLSTVWRNIVGAFLWTYGFTYLGYYAGKVLHDMGINVEIAALIIIFLSITPMLWHALHTEEKRANLWAGTKRELQIILSKRGVR